MCGGLNSDLPTWRFVILPFRRAGHQLLHLLKNLLLWLTTVHVTFLKVRCLLNMSIIFRQRPWNAGNKVFGYEWGERDFWSQGISPARKFIFQCIDKTSYERAFIAGRCLRIDHYTSRRIIQFSGCCGSICFSNYSILFLDTEISENSHWTG
jgi:hypothetical protein